MKVIPGNFGKKEGKENSKKPLEQLMEYIENTSMAEETEGDFVFMLNTPQALYLLTNGNSYGDALLAVDIARTHIIAASLGGVEDER